MSRFFDCQRCGAMVVEAQWERHLVDHATGKLATLPIVEAMAINELAHEIAPMAMSEDFGPEKER